MTFVVRDGILGDVFIRQPRIAATKPKVEQGVPFALPARDVVIHQKERAQASSPWAQYARHFADVVMGIVGEQVREEGSREREVHTGVAEREAEVAGLLAARSVVAAVEDIRVMESKVWEAWRDALLAPGHACADDIEAVVAGGRLQKRGERHGHPADARVDVEDSMLRLEPGK